MFFHTQYGKAIHLCVCVCVCAKSTYLGINGGHFAVTLTYPHLTHKALRLSNPDLDRTLHLNEIRSPQSVP
jgi:hypothetical protein